MMTKNVNAKKPNSGFYFFQPRPAVPPIYQATEFDGKRLRKTIARKTVDYNSSICKILESRIWQKDYYDRRELQPDTGYYPDIVPPISMLDNPVNCVTTKFVRTSTNKMRCPIFCVLWTPEGRRLVTGASSGEFTLWNGLTFNFETILQAHDSSVRAMVWSRNDGWMVTADHGGYVKYWQSNMNNVKMFQAHKEPVRAISMCPTDIKFATCSDDGTIRIWDFYRCLEERILRGHGAEVKGVDWHPTKSLVVSGSKDSQQPIKLWDPKSGQNLATLHAHKNTVMDVKWNKNGNWLLTASRDHLIKIFDIRMMSQEMQTFRGHKKEACCLAWHPIHESLFASGGNDGSILFWMVGTEKEIGGMEQAHDSVIWSLDWHPLGHILASGSNDHTCKFWTRNRPGDKMRDKYNLNLLPKGHEEAEFDDIDTAPSIPGISYEWNESEAYDEDSAILSIPGIGDSDTKTDESQMNNQPQRKVPFSKPVPKQFENQWIDRKPVVLPPPPPPLPSSMHSGEASEDGKLSYLKPSVGPSGFDQESSIRLPPIPPRPSQQFDQYDYGRNSPNYDMGPPPPNGGSFRGPPMPPTTHHLQSTVPDEENYDHLMMEDEPLYGQNDEDFRQANAGNQVFDFRHEAQNNWQKPPHDVVPHTRWRGPARDNEMWQRSERGRGRGNDSRWDHRRRNGNPRWQRERGPHGDDEFYA